MEEIAKIVAISKPDDLDSRGAPIYELGKQTPMTPGEFIAYCARVSNPANQNNNLTAPKLLKYLVNHSHWSPFEMVSITMEINTTRDIGRQILRHRSFSFQEFSQRYADVSTLGFHTREPRYQDKKNRQNSTEFKISDEHDEELRKEWFSRIGTIVDNASSTYKWALENGIAKEQARVVLPEGLTETRMYMAGTVRSWIHYCQLRTDRMIDPRNGERIKGTQKEHKEVAQACWDAIVTRLPELKEVLE